MAQLTLYVDAETQKRLKKAAKAAGMSQSRWVAELIRKQTASEWPASIVLLAGAWKDFPDQAEIRRGEGKDVPREPF